MIADLIGFNQDASEDALESILEARDTRFIASLIEIMRGRQLGIVWSVGTAEWPRESPGIWPIGSAGTPSSPIPSP